MYRIIGSDGREYGPVTAEQLRQWIAENRVNAQTMVRREGDAELTPLANVPELAVLLTPAPPMEPAGPVSAAELTAQFPAGGREVDIGSCISRSWELFKKSFWQQVGAVVIVGLLLGGVGSVLRVGINLAAGVPFGARGLHGLRMQLPGILISSLWSTLVAGALVGGLCRFYLNLIRGQTASISDVFSGFPVAFGQLTLAYIVKSILTFIGFCLCILPGIYLSVAWKFTLPLVIDKRLGFWEAMQLSRKAVHPQWWILFALVLLTGLLAAAGILVCCIGVFVTAPVAAGAIMYAYEDIFGERTAQTA
jgi:hypothetical protein